MSSGGRGFLLAACVLLMATVLCAPPAARASSADTLTVLFSAETRGNLTTCTCPTQPLGGLARRVHFLQEASGTLGRAGSCLVLDAGGFLPVGRAPVRDDPEAAAQLVRLLLRGMAESGVVATALDYRERAFVEKAAPAECRRLHDCLLDADPPGPPRIVLWGKEKIALLALEESLADSVIIASGVRARAEADYLIVLARADAFTGCRVARLSRADLVLLSRGARPTEPLWEGRSLLVGCGVAGREIGEVRLIRGDLPHQGTGAPPAASTASTLQREGSPSSEPPERTTSQGLRLTGYRLIPMDGSVAEDPELADSVAELLRLGSAAPLVAGSRD